MKTCSAVSIKPSPGFQFKPRFMSSPSISTDQHDGPIAQMILVFRLRAGGGCRICFIPIVPTWKFCRKTQHTHHATGFISYICTNITTTTRTKSSTRCQQGFAHERTLMTGLRAAVDDGAGASIMSANSCDAER